jgi:hypothetical protein
MPRKVGIHDFACKQRKAVDAVAKPRHDGSAHVLHLSPAWTVLAQPRCSVHRAFVQIATIVPAFGQMR